MNQKVWTILVCLVSAGLALQQSNQTVEEAIEELKFEILRLKGVVEILNATINTNLENIEKNSVDIVDNSKDITNLNIHQGHMGETVYNLGVQISKHAENIDTNQVNIEANRGSIQTNEQNIKTNEQNIKTNQQNINTNKNNIELNKHSTNINQQSIYNNQIDILKTNREIQLLGLRFEDLSDSFKRSNLKFHGEMKVVNSRWPHNTDVTYDYELVDTHNAFDPATGTFTAPFDGTYGFIFKALLLAETGTLSALHNDVKISVWTRYITSTVNYDESSTVYFALNLKRNDKVKIYSGTSYIGLEYIHNNFMGFLIQ